MHGVEGLLPRLEHSVHHVPVFLPGGGAHGIEHGLVQTLHLFTRAGDRIGIVLPGGFLVRRDVEFGLQRGKVAARVPGPAHHPGTGAAHWASARSSRWLSHRTDSNAGQSGDGRAEHGSASNIECHSWYLISRQRDLLYSSRGGALIWINTSPATGHAVTKPFPFLSHAVASGSLSTR